MRLSVKATFVFYWSFLLLSILLWIFVVFYDSFGQPVMFLTEDTSTMLLLVAVIGSVASLLGG